MNARLDESQAGIKIAGRNIIYLSEVVDISPNLLDSSLGFIQPSISHDALCIEIK